MYIQKHACMNAHTYPHRCMYATNATLLIKVVLPIHTKQKYFISDIPHLYLHQEVIVTYPECLCYGKFANDWSLWLYHFHYHACWSDLVSLVAAQNFCPLNVHYDSLAPLSQWIFFLFLSLKKKSCKLCHLDQV